MIDVIRKAFKKGDRKYGPVPFWWWSGDTITKERISWQLEKYHHGGIENIGVINIAPTGPQYGSISDNPSWFSESWWELYTYFIEEADRLNMKVWFYDQIGFSGSNFPAKIVSENPQYAGYQLKRYKSVKAIPVGSNILSQIDDYYYVEIRQGFNWLDKNGCRELINMIHGELERRLGKYLGKVIVGTMQDELPPLSLWNENIPVIYEKNFGEELSSQLNTLFDDTKNSYVVRQRVYDIAADLAEQAFFIPLENWHNKYNLFLSCDQAGPARSVNVHGAQRLYLDYFKEMRHYNSAGCDMDGEIKPHVSLSHLHGGQRVWLEAFHSSGWGGTLEDTMDWLVPFIQGGITIYSPHATYFTTKGGWWEWAAPDTGWRQPYFKHYSIFADTISRIFMLLTKGIHKSGVCVYYPSYAATGMMSLNDGAENEHPMAVASRMPNKKLSDLQETFEEIVGSYSRKSPDNLGIIRSQNFDYDIIDDLAIMNSKVIGNKLVVNGEEFSAMIFPCTTNMKKLARNKINDWISKGGKVSVYKPWEKQDIMDTELIKEKNNLINFINENIERFVEGAGPYLHRTIEEADVFLLLPDKEPLFKMHEVTTYKKEKQKYSIFRIKTKNIPQVWNPVNGEIREIDYQRNGDWVELSVEFTDWPACLIVCDELDNQYSKMSGNNKKANILALTENWKIKAIPYLDNKFGDFNLNYYKGIPSDKVHVETRKVAVQHESELSISEKKACILPDFDDSSWKKLNWSEGAYWELSKNNQFIGETEDIVYSQYFGDLSFKTWAGRMGRVPRRFINVGCLNKGENRWLRSFINIEKECDYWIRVEGNADLEIRIDGNRIELIGGNEDQQGRCYLSKGRHQVTIKLSALDSGVNRFGIELNTDKMVTLPKWIYLSQKTEFNYLEKVINSKEIKIRKVELNFAAKERVKLFINDKLIIEHGDFNPYIRQGQEKLVVTSIWKKGKNSIKFVFPEGVGEGYLDGAIEYEDGTNDIFFSDSNWRDRSGEEALEFHEAVLQFAETESLWYNKRPHPLKKVDWLMSNPHSQNEPIDFYHPEIDSNSPIWLRLRLPIGVKQIRIDVKGSIKVWVQGEEQKVIEDLVTLAPSAPGDLAVIRVEPGENCSYADVLQSPIVYETDYSKGSLGSWIDKLYLESFSGIVEYRQDFYLPEKAQLTVDLGFVRGSAEVWIDGEYIDTRIWQPYNFSKKGKVYHSGKHSLSIKVANSLGAHYHTCRPSDVVGGENQYWNIDENMAGKREEFIDSGIFGPVKIFWWSQDRSFFI